MPLSVFKKIKSLTSKNLMPGSTQLSFVIRFILTLGHGQACVERWSNLNNAVLKINMSPNTIIAKRIIKDPVLSSDLAPLTIIIPPAKYYIHLEEEKKNKVESEMEMRARNH